MGRRIGSDSGIYGRKEGVAESVGSGLLKKKLMER
jgi:hypothetical protein